MFAATAAASRVLGLSGAQVTDALGHAGQQTAGLMAVQHGGMGKRLLAGKAAQSGTLAAVLAEAGFTNARGTFSNASTGDSVRRSAGGSGRTRWRSW